MLGRLTRGLVRLLLAATLLGTMLGGAAFAASPRGRAECPMSRLHGCCKKMRQRSRAPGLAPTRLCCVVNCPQPAPAGSNFTFQSSPGGTTAPRPNAAAAPPAQALAQARDYSPPFLPSHSPPAYLRHAAFLI